MSSSIINYIIDKYLSKFLEINPEKTKSSIWSGTVELNNIKFKKEIFEKLNLPYLELVDGVISKIKVSLSLPRFYLYPIQVNVENVFFYAKQKDINNLTKEKEIELMESFKNSRLSSFEGLLQNAKDLQEESPSIINQIINNLHIVIKNIVFRFDDPVSYSKTPFKFGLILKYLTLKPLDSLDTQDTSINYKTAELEGFSVYLDYTKKDNYKEEFDFRKKICIEESKYIDATSKSYLGNSLDFYLYCMSEVEKYSQNENSHFYLLYNLCLSVKAALNEKSEKNMKPKIKLEVDFPDILVNLHFPQLKCAMKLISYVKLKDYYQKGLEKEYFVRELSDSEKEDYIQNYTYYYQTKYTVPDEEENKKYSDIINAYEKGLPYNAIVSMRSIAFNKLSYLNTIKGIDDQIKTIEGKWLMSSSKKKKMIEELNKKKEDLTKANLLEAKNYYKDFINDLFKSEKDLSKEDNQIYFFMIDSKRFLFSISESPEKKILTFTSTNVELSTEINTLSITFSMSIGEIEMKQFISNKVQYEKIMYVKNYSNEEEKKMFSFIYNYNPKMEQTSCHKIYLRTDGNLMLIYNKYFIGYVSQKFTKTLKSGINFTKLGRSLNKELTKSIKKGYNMLISASDQSKNDINKRPRANVLIDINCPNIFIPEDFLGFKSKDNNGLVVSFGKVKVKSNLIQAKSGVDYSSILKKEDAFDRYIVDITGISVSYGIGYEDDNFKDPEEMIQMIKDVRITTTLFSIVDNRNKNFDQYSVDVKFSEVNLSFEEKVILCLVYCLENMKREQNLLERVWILEKLDKNVEGGKDSVQKEEEKKKESQVEPQKQSPTEERKFFSFNFTLPKLSVVIIKSPSSISSDNNNFSFMELNLDNITFFLSLTTINRVTAKVNLLYMSLNELGEEKPFEILAPLAEKSENIKTISIEYTLEPKDNISMITGEMCEFGLNFDVEFLAKVYQFLSFYLDFYNSRIELVAEEATMEIPLDSLAILSKSLTSTLGFKSLLKQPLQKVTTVKPRQTSSQKSKAELNVSFILKQIEINLVQIKDYSKVKKMQIATSLSFSLNQKSEIEKIFNDKGDVIELNYLENTKRMSLELSSTQGKFLSKKASEKDIFLDKFAIKVGYNEEIDLASSSVKATSSLSSNLFTINISLHHMHCFYDMMMELKDSASLFQKNYYSKVTEEIQSNPVAKKYAFNTQAIQKEFTKIKENKKMNKVSTNIEKFNVSLISDIKIADISFMLSDFYFGKKYTFFSANIKNISSKYQTMSDPSDGTNFGFGLIEMISGKRFPIDQFFSHPLHKMFLLSFGIEVNYLNLHFLQYESLIEPIDFSIKMIQIIPKMRSRLEVSSTKMLNVNITSNVFKSFNIISKLYKRKKVMESDESVADTSETSTEKQPYVKFVNLLGIPCTFWFDFNHMKYLSLEAGETKCFSYEEYLKITQEDKRTKKNISISAKFPGFDKNIENFNYTYNHVMSFEIKTRKSESVILKVKSEIDREMIRTISFYTSILIENSTTYLINFIQPKTNEKVALKPNENAYFKVPLLMEPLEVEIEGEKLLMNYSLNELLKKDQAKEHPIKTFPSGINICFDVACYSPIKKEISSTKDVIDRSLYKIIISPPLQIANKSPFTFTVTNVEGPINPLNSKHMYKVPYMSTDHNLLSKFFKLINLTYISSNYNNSKFSFLSVEEKNVDNKKKFIMRFSSSELNRIQRCTMIATDHPSIEGVRYFAEKEVKRTSMRYTLYFDYFITNRLRYNINIKSSTGDVDAFHHMYVCESDIDKKVKVLVEGCKLSNEIDISTPEVELLMKVNSDNSSITRNISVMTRLSTVYPLTKCIIFAPRYIIYNDTEINFSYRKSGSKKLHEIPPNKNTIIEEDLDGIKNSIYEIGTKADEMWPVDFEKIEHFDFKVKASGDAEKSFSYGDGNKYELFHYISSTFDQGTIFIAITRPKYPMYEIENQTSFQVEVQDKEKTKLPSNSVTPYINTGDKDNETFTCLINNEKVTFSFTKFDVKVKYTVINGNKSSIRLKVHPENNNYTKKLIITSSDFLLNKPKKQTEILIDNLKKRSGILINILLPGLGVSFINDVPEEIFYLVLYDITMNLSVLNISQVAVEETNQNIELYVKNIQLDYQKEDSYPTIISPKVQILPSTEAEIYKEDPSTPPFFQCFVSKTTKVTQVLVAGEIKKDIQVEYPVIELVLQELDTKIDHFVFNSLLNLVNDYMYNLEKKLTDIEPTFAKKESNLETEIKFPLEEILLSKQGSLYAIHYILISTLKVNVTFKIDANLINLEHVPSLIENILKGIASFASVSNLPFTFHEIKFEDIFTDSKSLSKVIIENYKSEGIKQAYKVLFGIDLLGNPVNLLSDIGKGFVSLVDEPRKGFSKGPKGFGKGIAAGVSSLVSNVVTGSLDSVSKITGSLYSATKYIQGEKKQNVTSFQEEKEKPKGLIDGALKGIGKGFGELTSGIGGLFSKPVEKAKEEGVKGFFKGVGSGVVGAVVSPVSAVLSVGNSVASGASNSEMFDKNKKKTGVRFRPVRKFNDSLITPYTPATQDKKSS